MNPSVSTFEEPIELYTEEEWEEELSWGPTRVITPPEANPVIRKSSVHGFMKPSGPPTRIPS